MFLSSLVEKLVLVGPFWIGFPLVLLRLNGLGVT